MRPPGAAAVSRRAGALEEVDASDGMKEERGVGWITVGAGGVGCSPVRWGRSIVRTPRLASVPASIAAEDQRRSEMSCEPAWALPRAKPEVGSVNHPVVRVPA